jgi:hypothetical protein
MRRKKKDSAVDRKKQKEKKQKESLTKIHVRHF